MMKSFPIKHLVLPGVHKESATALAVKCVYFLALNNATLKQNLSKCVIFVVVVRR